MDSETSARQCAELAGCGVRALVEVDSGQHRSGVPADEAGRVALAASRAGLDVDGVFTFPGHGYAPGRAGTAAAEEAAALAAGADALGSRRARARVS